MWSKRVDPIDELAVARSLSTQPGFAWLDANRIESRDGRFSFLAAWPTDEIRVEFGDPRPFDSLAEIGPSSVEASTDGLGPADVPEWIGYIAYDAFWSAPARGKPRFERPSDPVVLFRRYPALYAIDHETGEAWVVGDDETACERLVNHVDPQDSPDWQIPKIGRVQVDDPGAHRKSIVNALDYIAQGDVYEVNLARRWTASFEGDALGLWQAMRLASRVPLGLFYAAADHSVLACTMERFIHWDSTTRSLVTKPIKGTIRREPADGGASARLRADPKEQAEHSMIVDLMRNDLGRVAEIGSVEVDAPLVVEPFTGLYHLVSTVRCVTRENVTLGDVLEATFPPGSVTGAPKIRALEIIEELEPHPRGVYCGALGFVDRAGGLSLAVAIRTATVRRGEVHYWAGGGIVEASDPDREVAETDLKAKVFLDAVQSVRGTSDD